MIKAADLLDNLLPVLLTMIRPIQEAEDVAITAELAAAIVVVVAATKVDVLPDTITLRQSILRD